MGSLSDTENYRNAGGGPQERWCVLGGQEMLFEQLGEPNQDKLALPERYERRQTASQPGSNQQVVTRLRQLSRWEVDLREPVRHWAEYRSRERRRAINRAEHNQRIIRIDPLAAGIVVLTLATALIHFWLGIALGPPGLAPFPLLFYLNGLGYLVLLAALYLPSLRAVRQRIRCLLIVTWKAIWIRHLRAS